MSHYEQIGLEMGQLLDQKRLQYGANFDTAPKVLALLYPNGVTPDKYGNLLAIVRIIDKLGRIATARADDPEDAWRDIAGYGMLMVAQDREGHHD